MAGRENIELSTETPHASVGGGGVGGGGVWGAEHTKPDISVTSELLSSLREVQKYGNA